MSEYKGLFYNKNQIKKIYLFGAHFDYFELYEKLLKLKNFNLEKNIKEKINYNRTIIKAKNINENKNIYLNVIKNKQQILNKSKSLNNIYNKNNRNLNNQFLIKMKSKENFINEKLKYNLIKSQLINLSQMIDLKTQFFRYKNNFLN